MEDLPVKYFDSLYPPETRKKEIHDYLDILKRGLSAQVIGIPGVGRSSVLRLLAYNRDVRTFHFQDYEKIMHFVYLDSSEFKNLSNQDINKLIFSSIQQSLLDRRMNKLASTIKDLLHEGLSYNDNTLLVQHLKKAIDYLTIENKLTLVLLFDKFDSAVPNLSSDFFTMLKSLRDRAKYRFGVVFSLKRPLEDTVDINIITGFSEIVSGNEIYISIYDPVAIKFRLDYIEKMARVKIDDKVRSEVVELTGGHSRLAKIAFENLTSSNEKSKNLKEYLLKKNTVNNSLKEIWDCLMPSEKTALKQKLKYDQIVDTYPYLVKSGLVEPNGITIPLLEKFIETTDIKNNEKIYYNPETNEIYKGNITLSDKLSSSEFKLLKYLIENKGKVLSKDEIITNVWSDQKTQEGVTDQALDQILYRLRKKIETDPQSSKYIQTLKGTGYKFIGD